MASPMSSLTPAYQQILYEVSSFVATLTLNRPDKLNAWTPKMEEEVTAALRVASTDEQVRVIVLTGAGKGFCAGADMSLLSALAQETAPAPWQNLGAEMNGNMRAPISAVKHAWLASACLGR